MIINTNNSITICASLAGLMALNIACYCLPAYATRQAAELASAVKTIFPDMRFRLDGALESGGELYLPILPPSQTKKAKVILLESFTAQKKSPKPEILLFDNGVAFVKVVTAGKGKSFPALSGCSEKLRKAILAGHLAEDLIVPENFSLAAAWKPVVGQTAVHLESSHTASGTHSGSETGSNTGSHTGTNPASGHEITAAALTPKHGGIFLTSRNSGIITVVDDKTWKKICEFPTEGTPAGMVYVNGRIYIADQSRSRILILDPVGKRFVGQIDLLPKSAPKAVLALPNGKMLYVSESGSADVAIIEVDTARVLLRTKVGPGPAHMAITPNGNTILVLNSATGQVTFISTLNQRVLGVVTVGANPSSVVISPDGKTGYVSCRGTANRIAVIDIPRRGVLANLKTGNGPTGLALSADGATLYNAVAKDNIIAVFDTASRSSVKQIKLPLDIDFPGNITLTPDGKKLIVSSATTNAFGVLDTASGEFELQPVIDQTSDEIIWAPIE